MEGWETATCAVAIEAELATGGTSHFHAPCILHWWLSIQNKPVGTDMTLSPSYVQADTGLRTMRTAHGAAARM